MQKSEITIELRMKQNINFMQPSAKVFPLKPRSLEMLSSGSLTTLDKARVIKKRGIFFFHAST